MSYHIFFKCFDYENLHSTYYIPTSPEARVVTQGVVILFSEILLCLFKWNNKFEVPPDVATSNEQSFYLVFIIVFFAEIVPAF